MERGETDLLKSLKEKRKKDRIILGAGVDNPEDETWYVDAGCDFILLYPTAGYTGAKNRFLAGFLAIGNSNELMRSLVEESVSVISGRYVFAGVNCTDPFKHDRFLFETMKKCGIPGIHNYPPMSFVDGQFGINLENLKEGVEKEIQFLKKGKKEGFVTCAMAAGRRQAVRFARAGVDILILFIGLGETLPNYQSIVEYYEKKLKEIAGAVRKISPDMPLLFTGDQRTSADERIDILRRVKEIDGYLFLPVTLENSTQRIRKAEIEQMEYARIPVK